MDTKVKVGCRFSLLDQAGEPVPKHTRAYLTETCYTDGHGITCHKFIRREELENSTYLEDDRFSIRCQVRVAKEIITQPNKARFVTAATPSDMSHQVGRILETGEGADVTFEVAGETFAARSSVFKAQLFGPLMEKDAACVRIDGMEARVFKMMLHFIYTDTLPSIDGSEITEAAQHFFVAADRYDLERLKLICQNTLCHYMDASMVATTLALAEQHGCDDLKTACYKFLASFPNLKAVIATDGYKHLKTIRPNILEELLRCRAADAP